MGTTRTALNTGHMLAQTNNPGHERDEALLSWIQQLAPYGVITLDESFQV